MLPGPAVGPGPRNPRGHASPAPTIPGCHCLPAADRRNCSRQPSGVQTAGQIVRGHSAVSPAVLFDQIENASAAPLADLQPPVPALGGLAALGGPAPLFAASKKIEATGVAALVRARAPLHSRTFDPGVVGGRWVCRFHASPAILQSDTFQGSIPCRRDSVEVLNSIL